MLKKYYVNNINLMYNKLIEIEKNNKEFSLTEKTLVITAKISTTTIALNKITNVRITKCRSLLINYLLGFLILLFYYFLESFIENYSTLLLLLKTIFLIAFVGSFNIKNYSYSVLINTINLNYVKVKINTKKQKLKSYFIPKTDY
ncbi:hypothetical protein FFWV33_16825 [Flavobacterium faecale]|uniref:Uncharacterized protein n=1 Tax=Flavobacterium faecale TaxID=1355330 RepID=A0A2S1LH86_9FLAO|nr:hypothetical protein FFWV33_16825 [Flavobacterium faecale]